MRGWQLRPATALITFLTAAPLWSSPAPDVTGSLEWRLVGPFRGGWATAVAGAGSATNTFYLGAAGGGVWKTEDAGLTWHAVFDGVGSASVGALAVAPSHPDTVYAGMGQVTSRYDITPGDGLYRSDDAGRSWHNVGLASTRHIGAIVVDPRDPQSVLVAALGSVFGPSNERGVYRTTDGGKNWTRTLFVSENAGAVDLAFDPADPQVVFASVWQVRYRPWLSYFTPDAGPESGVYRSGDGGLSWTRLAGGGWPTNDLGRIGLAVSHRAQGTRVWAVVDAEKNGGLYRSDDAGRTWLHVNDDHELVSSYFAKLTPVPGDPDTVFSMGRGIQRCTKSGTECDVFKGAPGGDDYHFLWIDPQHPERMITGADQGAAITTNGGRTWSSWYNQPTGQFYKLATDSAFPYRIFGGQQDSGTVRISSRSDDGSITLRDWRPVGGDERDYQVADPRNPDIVYSSGLGGRLSRWDGRNGEVQNVTPWPIASYGQRPTDFQLRYSWITPIAISSLAPYPLYFGSQQLWRSTEQGEHWEAISPDLSARSAQPGDCRGRLEPPRARECGYGVIWSIGLSPRDNDEIWVGTDDGIVRMTGDGGKFWTEVTPKGVPAWAKISTVEPSAIEPGVAYVAVDNHRQDDFRPLVYRTRDRGATWSLVANGLPANHFVSVVRPDPVKAGLLYAGTDIGAYYSIDDGANWKPLQRNLPTAWVRDLLVKGDDLIAATQGRAIWVLDGLAPLRQAADVAAGAKTHLFAPAPAIRLRRNQNRDTPLPPEEPAGVNPPTGALIDYWLAAPAKRVELEIRDSVGALVHEFESGATEPQQTVERYFAASWLKPAATLGAAAGMHRFVWNLRYPPPRTTEYEYSIATAWGAGVETAPRGILAAPGIYRVVLRVDGKEFTTPLTVAADPRVAVDATALEQSHSASRDAERLLARHYDTAAPMQYVQERVKELRKDKSGVPAVLSALDAYDAAVKPLVASEGDLPDNIGVKAIGSQLRSLATDIEESDRVPTDPQQRALAEAGRRLDRAAVAWANARRTALPKLNASLKTAGIEPIVIPPVDRIKLDGPGESKEMP